MKPSRIMYFITAGMPPMLCTSSITYLPLGFRSAMNGTRSLTFWKSSMVRSTSTERAIAIRCSTALVEPPSAITITIAFSNASRVMMSRGLRSRSSRLRIAAPAAKHSSSLRGWVAGVDELYGSDMPIASIAVAIVFAVYMPPQPPGPGQALRTMALRSSSSMLPARYCP